MKLILPLLGLLLGTGAGVGAGMFLALPPEDVTDATDPVTDEGSETSTAAADADQPSAIVSLNNQFVVPLVEQDRVAAMVVLSTGLEVVEGTTEAAYAQEPRLRDRFLAVLFEHAHMGGFSGAFASPRQLDLLRRSLFDAARLELGETVTGILITDLARQDV